MNTYILRCTLLALVVVSPAHAVFCSTPSNTGITNTWAPGAAVVVVAHPTIVGQAGTASINYNLGFFTYLNPLLAPYGICFNPTFSTGVSRFAQTIWMDYGAIAATPDCQPPACIIRGQTNLGGATRVGGRLYSVNAIINSLVTVSAAITEVIAHEIGHTLGLADCPYPLLRAQQFSDDLRGSSRD
jgi:hypothetical protein